MVDYNPNYFYPDPVDLYDPDPLHTVPLTSTYGPPVYGAITGAVVAGFCNYINRRPIKSGIPLYTISITCSVAAWVGCKEVSRWYFTKRDQIHRHYVKLHPEEFPPLTKTKIGDLLEDWEPGR